ncbi:MAG: winged helix-turn-helix domain-containing protein [Gemmatimonadota bacterium]
MIRIGTDRIAVALVAPRGQFALMVEKELREPGVVTMRCDDHAGLQNALDDELPDIVVVDETSCPTPVGQLQAIRAQLPIAQIVHLRAGDAARCNTLIEWGADDAIDRSPAWPIRIRSVLRRARAIKSLEQTAIGDVILDHRTRQVWCSGEETRLTRLEFEVLHLLFKSAPCAVRTECIAAAVWKDRSERQQRTLVQTYVCYLRQKLASSESVALRFCKVRGYYFGPRRKADRSISIERAGVRMYANGDAG